MNHIEYNADGDTRVSFNLMKSPVLGLSIYFDDVCAIDIHHGDDQESFAALSLYGADHAKIQAAVDAFNAVMRGDFRDVEIVNGEK